jgi:3-hydroxyisobutyrate dehydrogenase-like beta-hydroxyacid dehydrogenase
MYAGDDETVATMLPILEGLSDRRFRAGVKPGMAQAVKLANNFLSATALVATSEAVAFAEAHGVHPGVAVDIFNNGTGRNSATVDKFPRQVLTGRFAAGFTSGLMDKDLALYAEAMGNRGVPSTVGGTVAVFWHGFAAEGPEADFTRIYPFVKGEGA